MAEWTPQSATPIEDDWVPSSAKVVVKQHTRKRTSGIGASVGGFIGGIAGGTAGAVAGPVGVIAGRVGGAGAGGAVGEAIEQAGPQLFGPSPAMALASLNPQDIASQAGLQAGVEGLGLGVSKLAQIGGRPLMQWAIKSTPEVAQVAIREGIVGTRKGLAKLMEKIGKSGEKTREIIAAATRRGAQYQSADIAVELGRQLIPDLAGQAHVTPDMRILQSMSSQFLKDHPGLIPASQLQMIKQSSDNIAAPIYSAIKRKEPITGRQRIQYRWHKALADHARELLDNIKGVPEQNARTAELIKVKEALVPVVRRAPSLGARVVGRGIGPAAGGAIGYAIPGDISERTKHGIEGAALGAIITSPTMLSQLALGLNNPLLLALLRQSPRTLATTSAPRKEE